MATIKEKVLAALKTSYADKGFKGDELESLADIAISMNLTDESSEEDVSAVVNGATIKSSAVLMQKIGNRYASDVTKKLEDKYKGYKAPGDDAQPSPQVPDDRYAALEERIAELTAAMKGNQAKATADQLRSQLNGKGTELGVSNANLWADAVNSVQYSDGMTIEQMESAAKMCYESQLSRYFGNGTQPYGSTSSSPNVEQGKKELDDYFAEKFGTK